MSKNKANTGALCAVLVIVAMIVGILIGILIGRTMGSSSQNQESETFLETTDLNVGESQTDTGTSVEEQTGQNNETVPQSGESGGEVTVLTINGRSVSMEEINYYLYQQRDYFVREYGEEPWSIVMDDGRTVGEYAKEQLYNDIVRTQVLIGHAQDYGISLADEMNAQLADSAQEYVDGLGSEICQQFGLNTSAIAKVYQDQELANAVTTAVRDELSAQMESDENYRGLSEEDFSSALDDAYNALYTQWLEDADIQTTDIWDTIVVGSAG